jgi:uncharacterized membrane protein
MESSTTRTPWIVALVAAVLGVGFTGTQIVERIAILKDPAATLACDVNSVLSCSGVLAAWQSSVIIGIPNAFIGAVMFSLFLATAFGGLVGTVFPRAYLLTAWGLVVFFAAFATWFMIETSFVIGALCLWCTGIVTAVALIGGAFTRVLLRSGALGSGATAQRWQRWSHSGIDVAIWLGWWLVVIGLLAVGLLL